MADSPIPVRVVVFEASEMSCQLLAYALERSEFALKVTGSATTSMGLDESLINNADVAVINSDLREGPGSGLRLLRSMQLHDANLRCVMLIDRDDRQAVIEAFRSGASGVCQRDESWEVLSKCIFRVHHGQIWANTQQLHYILEALTANTAQARTAAGGRRALTRREEEIVALVTAGRKNREIADRLQLSEHTVKNYLFRIFEKLGISRRTELILYAARERGFQ